MMETRKILFYRLQLVNLTSKSGSAQPWDKANRLYCHAISCSAIAIDIPEGFHVSNSHGTSTKSFILDGSIMLLTKAAIPLGNR